MAAVASASPAPPAPSAAPPAPMPSAALGVQVPYMKRIALLRQLGSVLRALGYEREDITDYPETQSGFPEAPQSSPCNWTKNGAFCVVLSNRSRVAAVTHVKLEVEWLLVAFRGSPVPNGTPTIFCTLDPAILSGGKVLSMREPKHRFHMLEGGTIAALIRNDGWQPDGEVRNPGIDVDLGLDVAAAEENAEAAEAVAKTARAAADAAHARFKKACEAGAKK